VQRNHCDFCISNLEFTISNVDNWISNIESRNSRHSDSDFYLSPIFYTNKSRARSGIQESSVQFCAAGPKIQIFRPMVSAEHEPIAAIPVGHRSCRYTIHQPPYTERCCSTRRPQTDGILSQTICLEAEMNLKTTWMMNMLLSRCVNQLSSELHHYAIGQCVPLCKREPALLISGGIRLAHEKGQDLK
jgi:hypothetical protein